MRTLLLLLLAGCGQNAVLELELTFDGTASSCGRPWFQVQALFATDSGDPDCAFVGPAWDGALSTHGRMTTAGGDTSIVGEGAEQVEPLCVRVRYCASADCTDVGDNDGEDGAPTSFTGFRIDRAFYEGERTRLRLELRPDDCVTQTLSAIGKCEVAAEGCASGELVDWCRDDGTHFCE